MRSDHEVNGALMSCRGVTVHYGGVVAVQDIDLDVEVGQIRGLIGPNGAGKTSFIDAVSGFTASSGDVRFAGAMISRAGAHERARLGLSRTFQSLELFDDLTVEENVRLGEPRLPLNASAREVVRGGSGPAPESVRDLLETFELEPVRKRRVFELSHGKRKLVMLARALAAKPKLLLLDEPAAGLDNHESAELGKTLLEINRGGVSMLMVEHDMSLIMSLCSRITVIDFGRVISEGDAATVQSDPEVIKAYLGEPIAQAGA